MKNFKKQQMKFINIGVRCYDPNENNNDQDNGSSGPFSPDEQTSVEL